jgi:hypothetical protein
MRSWLSVLMLAVVLTVSVFASEGDVVLHPGTLSGSVSISGYQITSVTVYAIDTAKVYSATTSATAPAGANSIDYALTVEGGRDYYVIAEGAVSATDTIRALLPLAGPVNVPIDGNVTIDMSMAPAIISGTISTGSHSNTIEGYQVYAYIALPQFDQSPYSYTGAWSLSVPGDTGRNYTLLLAPGVQCDIYAYIEIDGVTHRRYDDNFVAPAAGTTVNRDYRIDVTAAAISGTALLQGVDVTGTRVYGYVDSPYRNASVAVPDVSTGTYTLNVDAGAWRLSPEFYFSFPGSLSHLKGSLELPYSTAMNINAGDQVTDVNFLVDPGFIPGTLELWGPSTNFSDADVEAYGSGGGYAYSEVDPNTGQFMFACSPGDWQTDYYQYFSFDYPDDPDPSLSSTVWQYHYSSTNVQTVTAGQTEPNIVLTYGTITVRRYFYVAGNGELSQPSIRAIRHESPYSRAYGYGSYSSTTEGQAMVTLLLPGTYTIEAFANVEGSNTEFGPVDVNVAPGDAVVIGGTDRPILQVTNPANGETICGDKVTVEGTVTDDKGIASIKINDVNIPFDSTANPIHFSDEISLDSGENQIRIEVSDVDHTEPVVLTMTVFSDDCRTECTLTITSGEGGSVVEPGVGAFVCESDTPIEVKAEPNDCYRFTHWTGTAVDANKVSDPNDPNTTVLMDADYTLEAHFAKIEYTLTTTSGKGGSVVTPGMGTFVYDCSARVNVGAKPEKYRHFTGWSGSAVDAGKVDDPTAASTTVTMDGNYTLHANFVCEQRVLSVSSTSGGSVDIWVSIDNVGRGWPGPQTLQFDHGTEITLTVNADPGYVFKNWSGTMWCTDTYLVFTLDQDHDLTANFLPAP